MKKMLVVLVGCMLLGFAAGCSTTTFSMNYQRAMARTGGDLSVTVVLENASTKISRDQIIKIANDIKAYLDKVDLTKVDSAALITQIQDLIPIAQLKPLAAYIVGKIPTDASKLQNGKILANECLDGIIMGASKFDAGQVTINVIVK